MLKENKVIFEICDTSQKCKAKNLKAKALLLTLIDSGFQITQDVVSYIYKSRSRIAMKKLYQLGAELIIKIFLYGFRIRLHVLPGGTMPERKTDEACGYDVFLRAIVSPHEMDPNDSRLRKPLFDFKTMPTDKPTRDKVETRNGKLVYRLDPGQTVLVGIGFATQMRFPMFYWTAPRSGLAAKWNITVTNAPGTVDADYRGEAGITIYNRNDQPYYIEHNMRIAQIIFQLAIIPQVEVIEKYEELSGTGRGAGGFGSTGLK